MRRVLTKAPLLGVALVALAFSLAPVMATQPAPKILRVWWGDTVPENLEPQTAEFATAQLTLLVFEGLTRFDEEFNVVPAAAESWEFNDDGTVITFHLRENLTYSDGSPLTAERFRYAIERRCDPHLPFFGASELFDIAGCQELNESLGSDEGTPVADEAAYEMAKANLGVHAIDDRTLEIQLTHPAPYFPALAQWLGFIPVKEEVIAAGGEEWWHDPANWVGNGPFRLAGIELDATPPRFTFAANERYWGGRPKLDGIEYRLMAREASLEAYRRGELDITFPEVYHYAPLEADPVLSRELEHMPAPLVEIFNLNLRREPFTDKQVREAFAYAFDRDAYCRELIHGACTPVLSWIPPRVPGAIETDAYAFDPAKAREALAASRYGGPESLPEIVWYYGDDDEWPRQQAEWIRDQFAQVLGVEMTLTPLPGDEVDALLDDPATWPQIANTYWSSSLPDPYEWNLFWLCGDEMFAADIGYCNPEYDALVARSARELDQEERIRLAQEAQRVLVADAPAIFGNTWDQIALVKPYVTGYIPGAPYQGWPGWATPLTVDIAPH